MTLHRCFAWDRRARPTERGGALWIARDYQGDGRHDNPDRFGCLYLAEEVTAAVVEQFARFRGSVFVPGMLKRRGLALALASLDVEGRLGLVNLDDPAVLATRGLRPSLVATRRRQVTQPQARAIHEAGADGIRWWSTFESLWGNVTLFDRAAPRLRMGAVVPLAPTHPALRDALEVLGIAAG